MLGQRNAREMAGDKKYWRETIIFREEGKLFIYARKAIVLVHKRDRK